jgi:bifunctional UDP-N-acetylglucosamine pyrophosphorylase/glucosamine-1-phosphate N-acetyltransferase
MNVDEFVTKEDLELLLRQQPNTLAVYEHDEAWRFGAVEIENGLVKNIVEKSPDIGKALINAGLYVLDESVFNMLEKLQPSPRGEIELTDVLTGAKIFQLSRWMTITYPWNILDVNEFILKEKGSMIDESAEIRPGAYIEEPVAIGAGAIIGPNCYIRKYSSIGADCKVGNAVEIKNSIIMDNSFVSHLSYVGDSIVGRNCNIAAGTLVANLKLDESNVGMNIKGERVDSGRRKLGAVIGDNVKFGAGCRIMPGKKIWPNILVPPCQLITKDIELQPELRGSVNNEQN